MRAVVLLFLLVGCGGKIVESASAEDRTISAQAAPSPPTTPPPPEERRDPVVVTPSSTTPLDACTVLCERDARCDTTLPALPSKDGDGGDCATRCEKRLAGKCGIDDWLLCYAERIDGSSCTPLPEECRPSFCAWARCAKQPVSSCE